MDNLIHSLHLFKEGDIVHRVYDNKNYKIIDASSSIWKLLCDNVITEWNACNNGGFKLVKDSNEVIQLSIF
jgi:hypothetical protein